MKNILIVSLFSEITNLNSRLNKVVNALRSSVSIVTPDFSHGEKKYKLAFDYSNSNSFPIEFIHVPDYNNNLSFKRIYSHLVFSFKLRSYLNRLKHKPDIVFCFMPPSSTAYFCGYYCKRNNIPFVIDIIDLWPDSLIPLFKFNSILKLILIPWRLLTKKAYSFANYISAESKEYALDAHRINPKVPWSYTYLGVNINQVEELISQSKLNLVKPVDEIWICYGGSLGHSYDFNCILKAIKFINQKGIKYKMLFIGDGEKRKHIEKFALKNKLQIQITGRVSYNDFLKYLSECDIGINSFKKGTRIVHSYKFNDYVSAKLFIINNLKGETSEMINKYKVGLNFSGDNLSEILYGVCLNWVRFSEYRSNINFLVKNELDSTVIYQKLASDILNL